MGGCLGARDTDDLFIQQKELQLQILLCTAADIKNGFFLLESASKYISRQQIKVGFEGMQNPITASLVKQESVVKLLDKFILPFRVSEKYYLLNDLLVALIVNSRSNTIDKATSIAEILFKEKDELNQEDIIFIFKKLFNIVMNYSFALMDQYGEEQRDFEKEKTLEEEENTIPSEATLLLWTGMNLGQIIGESLVEKDKSLTIEEFAEKCSSFIPDRFWRDVFVPKELRKSVRRDYENMDQVDKVAEEQKKKLKKQGKKQSEDIKKEEGDKKEENQENQQKEDEQDKEEDQQQNESEENQNQVKENEENQEMRQKDQEIQESVEKNLEEKVQ